ncbi:Ig-like domain-containing protein [Mucilaginibacter sp. 21P]|uniref:Ig-like domain-containing protein n=1 Tax=Mucilaginibacter sp. 21P TaxID=2778902 RepID=UPI001C5855E5|nr:Ig-like domain-containing protein [Mucilaginibacter sp. 21P]QXV66943.1 Ig-like domain-containing protein [Mucilaginibacter sp. 21P]
MKNILKATIAVILIATISSACKKTVDYKRQQTTQSDFAFADKNYGDADFDITPPTTNSPEPFTYISSNTNVATVNGSTVSIKGAGITTITATQRESDKFTQLAIAADFKVNRIAPTINNFPAVTKLASDAAFALTAPTSNSSGSILYTIADPTIASINGNIVTVKKAGKTTITASQIANGNYTAGTITTDLTVN